MALLHYVQGDTDPPIRTSLELSGSPIDVSAGGVTVRAHIRVLGQTTLKATLIGTKSTGLLTTVDEDNGAWTVDTNPPYNVAGFGGIVLFSPLPTTFDLVGMHEAQYEIDYGGGRKLTILKTDRIKVVPQFDS